MPTNCSNWLTSTCLTFVSYRSVRKRSAQQRCGSDYYPQTNDGKLVLVASSIQRRNPVQYNWSTTEPVEHPNAPPNWDSNQVLANVTGCKFQLNPLFTTTNTCRPQQFRQFNVEHGFCKKLTIANWFAMELCPSLQELACIECLNQFVIKTQQRAWYIWYANGCLEGMGWESFAAAHGLKEHDTIIVSVANDLSLVAMVFNQDGCERTFYWYIDI
ncbi:hypothetical protein RHMOL_Rhmol11G0097700 [Rhododendron molle]|uniref:Uncharacterized protein n=1 Tax=Rhododendron molle TaxID=49168 RepID=A0ACC0LS26_RHOML|nr:hypothetical protein RHMOL_Rhmol11G0097700 [Rhododendron molle]